MSKNNTYEEAISISIHVGYKVKDQGFNSNTFTSKTKVYNLSHLLSVPTMYFAAPDMTTSAESEGGEPRSYSATDGLHSSANHSVVSFHHREARITMENLNQFCKTHDTTPQSVYFTTWSIVLYHMTGQSDVSIDVESHSASALAERPGCETYNMILRSATTPLELISEYKFPDSSSSVEKGTKRSRDSNIKDRHMFKMIQDAGVFQDERNKFTSSSFVSLQSSNYEGPETDN